MVASRFTLSLAGKWRKSAPATQAACIDVLAREDSPRAARSLPEANGSSIPCVDPSKAGPEAPNGNPRTYTAQGGPSMAKKAAKKKTPAKKKGAAKRRAKKRK